MVAQALGEKAALDGFWYDVSESLNRVLHFAEDNPYLIVGVVVVLGYFLLRRK
jgi:hypothetical protein